MIGNGMSNQSAAYDGENRIASIGSGQISYAYDGDGERIFKNMSGPGGSSTGAIYWRGPDGTTLAETSLDGGTILSEYLYFDGKRIARVDSPATTPSLKWYFSDDLGSTSIIMDSTLTSTLEDIDYFPFGGIEQDYGSGDANHYKFTGKERDAESGLDNFGFRYYGSSLGRFMSPDEPFYDGDIHDPQKLNLYSYVRNSPTTSVDPDGHRVEICDTNGQNCTSISNDAYAQAQQQDQYNHAPTLDQLQKTEGESQNITDSNGNVVGTATRINAENAPVEGITPLGERYLAGYAMGAGIGRALSGAWGAVAGWFGRGAETVGATAGRATFQEVLQGAVEDGSGQATKSGGFAQATKDFEALEGQSQNLGGVQMKELPDGGKAVLRNFSKDGRPTLEYQPAGGGSKTQWIRYNP